MAEIYLEIVKITEQAKNLVSFFQKVDHTQTENLRKSVRKILRNSLKEDDLSENLKPCEPQSNILARHPNGQGVIPITIEVAGCD